MTLSELENVLAAAAPIFRKYSPNPTVVFSSGPAPINLQDFLFSAMSDEDRRKLITLGWKTNGKVAWFYEATSADTPATATPTSAFPAKRVWHT